jgi:hypothetical protein
LQARLRVLPGARGEIGQRSLRYIEGGSEVAATAMATEELPSATHACGGPAAGGNALAVLAAARLSAELALVALVPLAAVCAYEVPTAQLMSGPARGAWWTSSFYGVDYVNREAVIMYEEPNSISRRHRETNVSF